MVYSCKALAMGGGCPAAHHALPNYLADGEETYWQLRRLIPMFQQQKEPWLIIAGNTAASLPEHAGSNIPVRQTIWQCSGIR